MRVVYLGHSAALSGGELALLHLLPSLSRVDPLVVLAEDGPLVERLVKAGVEVDVLPLKDDVRGMSRHQVGGGLASLRSFLPLACYVARLYGYLRRVHPDLVHTNSLKASLYGGLAARLTGIPVIWHQRDRLSSDYLPTRAAALVRATARVCATAVIANSRATLETLGTMRQPTYVIPSPVVPPTRTFNPTTARTFALLGRIAPWKGQDLFLRAFAKAFPDGGRRALIVGAPLFGEHEYAKSLRDLVATLGLDGRVEFLGFREDLESALDGVDVLVHASRVPEPFGQVVVQGMSLGLAVIAADSGGPADIVTHEKDGLLYRTADIDGLVAALHRLADDESLLRRISRAGIATAARYSPSLIARAIEDAYTESLARTRPDGHRW